MLMLTDSLSYTYVHLPPCFIHAALHFNAIFCRAPSHPCDTAKDVSVMRRGLANAHPMFLWFLGHIFLTNTREPLFLADPSLVFACQSPSNHIHLKEFIFLTVVLEDARLIVIVWKSLFMKAPLSSKTSQSESTNNTLSLAFAIQTPLKDAALCSGPLRGTSKWVRELRL